MEQTKELTTQETTIKLCQLYRNVQSTLHYNYHDSFHALLFLQRGILVSDGNDEVYPDLEYSPHANQICCCYNLTRLDKTADSLENVTAIIRMYDSVLSDLEEGEVKQLVKKSLMHYGLYHDEKLKEFLRQDENAIGLKEFYYLYFAKSVEEHFSYVHKLYLYTASKLRRYNETNDC